MTKTQKQMIKKNELRRLGKEEPHSIWFISIIIILIGFISTFIYKSFLIWVVSVIISLLLMNFSYEIRNKLMGYKL